MKHLVIGLGEVGEAIAEIFKAEKHDPNKGFAANIYAEFDVMHICFPYSDKFISTLESYMTLLKHKYVVVHSTVPIGTCEKLGVNHSPIRGKHPHLKVSIQTFEKFIGGPDSVALSTIFEEHGIRVRAFSLARDVEAMKLWDTTQYGVMIMLEKEIHSFCEQNSLDFDIVYTQANETYNEGYKKMGNPWFTRPVLKHVEGKIGGHCVLQNCELLDSPVAKALSSSN